MTARVVVRRFRAGDIPFAHELRALARWNQTEHDWRGYLKFEPDGCFIAEVDGRPAGTATTIRYGDAFGWIGMVLVHPGRRRQGIGSELLRRAIAYLRESGVRCVKLDATPMGRPVYRPLGFLDEYELFRYEGPAPAGCAAVPGGVAPLTVADVGAIAPFDATVFGAERGHVLAELSARNPELCFVAPAAGGPRGYVIARVGAGAIQVGPWIARDPVTAEQLLLALFERVGGRTVFIDVLAPNGAGVELLKKHGLRVQRTLTRMYLGENTAPGRPELIYSISGAEKG
ncbi:MAG: GNAT family N-acetyltransferase [Opitutus sp.]|nr:GNAT family N-acetyltransferase [Opitutus sp.]